MHDGGTLREGRPSPLSKPTTHPPQPKRIEKAKILIANTSMDTDKIKIFGSRVRVDSMQKARHTVSLHVYGRVCIRVDACASCGVRARVC